MKNTEREELRILVITLSCFFFGILLTMSWSIPNIWFLVAAFIVLFSGIAIAVRLEPKDESNWYDDVHVMD